MNKRFSLVLVFLLGGAVPVRAIPPSAPRDFAGPIALVVPLECIAFDIIKRYAFDGRRGWQAIKNPKAWLGFAVCGIACGALSYYILQKYTPQYTFTWALGVKNEIEADPLIMCRNCNNEQVKQEILQCIRGRPFMTAVDDLYGQFKRLESAHSWITGAPVDVPDDVSFKRDCENLGQEIENLLSQISQYARRIIWTKQWFEELRGRAFNEQMSKLSFMNDAYLPERFINSFVWSIELINGRTTLTRKSGFGAIFSRPFLFEHVTFPEFFTSTLEDLSDQQNIESCD